MGLDECLGSNRVVRTPDRDRGEGSLPRPSHTTVRTGPYAAVRLVMLSARDQGRKAKRGEIGIRQGPVQSRALAHAPRAAAGAGGFRRLLPTHAPPDQFRVPLAACLPLSPESVAHTPPDRKSTRLNSSHLVIS